MVAVLALMAIAAGGAIRAIHAARSEAAADKCSEAVEKRAFQTFRTYSLCAAVSGITLMLLAMFL